jgi:hypothetical protein
MKVQRQMSGLFFSPGFLFLYPRLTRQSMGGAKHLAQGWLSSRCGIGPYIGDQQYVRVSKPVQSVHRHEH